VSSSIGESTLLMTEALNYYFENMRLQKKLISLNEENSYMQKMLQDANSKILLLETKIETLVANGD
jgi:hypothetical protein